MRQNESIHNTNNQLSQSDIPINLNIDSIVKKELAYSNTQAEPQKKALNVNFSNELAAVPYTPRSKQELLQEIIMSMTMEQRAVAQLIQAQTKHMQAYLSIESEMTRTTTEHYEFQAQLVRFVEGLVEKQKVSMRLLDMTKSMLREE